MTAVHTGICAAICMGEDPPLLRPTPPGLGAADASAASLRQTHRIVIFQPGLIHFNITTPQPACIASCPCQKPCGTMAAASAPTRKHTLRRPRSPPCLMLAPSRLKLLPLQVLPCQLLQLHL
jgi:hypothetical protein